MVMRSGYRNTVVLTSWRMNTLLMRTWLLYLSASSVFGELTKQCTSETTGPYSGICGKQLSNAMEMICMMHGGFFSRSSMLLEKKSSIDYLQKRKKRDLNLPLLSQQDAKTMFSKRMGRPVKQGIVCECCKHQCSMREMVEYCNLGSPGWGFNGGHRRRGRTVSQSRAKKWISAPDVVTNNAGAAVAAVEDAHVTNHQPGSRFADDNNDAGTILNYLTLLPSPVDPEESVVATHGGNTATEYDLIKEALLSNPRDYAEDITLLENFINTELDPVSKRLFVTSDKGRHSSYVTNDDSNSESSEINMTSDRNLKQILTRNRNYENLERFVPNAELSPGWLQTKLAHIDSLDKVSDWLRELGAPGLKLNDKHKISNKIEDEGGQ